MNRFVLYLRFGPLEVSEDSGVVKGESHIYTQQGNRHTIWTPQCMAEVEVACDGVLSLGEDPYGLAMNPADHQVLKSTILNGSSATKKRVPACECGATKLKLPFHSDWCPVK